MDCLEAYAEFLEMDGAVDEMPKNAQATGVEVGYVQYDTPVALQELPNDWDSVADVINKKYGLEPCQR